MPEAKMKSYQVQGFSCADCAGKFEKKVKRLEGVEDAKVNFGASKIVVQGNTTIEALEKAGAFENLKIRNEKEQITEHEPLWKQKESMKVYLSAIVLVISWVTGSQFGQQYPIVIIGYAAAILIGGFSLFVEGFRNLAHLDFDMDTLMTVAILGAAAIGKWGEGAAVVILFAISEALESYSTDKARQSIQSLMKIAPKET